jgi:hypothetical protein
MLTVVTVSFKSTDFPGHEELNIDKFNKKQLEIDILDKNP